MDLWRLRPPLLYLGLQLNYWRYTATQLNRMSMADRPSSLISYVVAGFAIGFGVGVFLASDAALPRTTADPFIISLAIGGALVGVELNVTYRWQRFGRFGHLARWLIATTSASLTVVRLMIHFGLLTRDATGAAILAAAGIGLVIWAADQRQRDRLR
jgi:hypothetical protein